MSFFHKRKNLVLLCIFLSIGFHIVALNSLNKLDVQPFTNKNALFVSKDSASNYRQKKPKEIINLILGKKQKQFSKGKISTSPIGELEIEIISISEIKPNHIDYDDVTLKINQPKISQKFELKQIIKAMPLDFLNSNSSNLLKDLKQKPLKEHKVEPAPQKSISAQIEKEISINNKNKLYKENTFELPKEFFEEFFKNANELTYNYTRSKIREFNPFSSLPPLLEIPSLEALNTQSYKNEFDIDIAFSPQANEDGYIFAITLLPKSEKSFKKLKRNYYFLLDKSNSIQNERLTSTRHAIVSSLNLLDEEDNFNILAFDSKISYLSSFDLSPDNGAIKKAKNFLLNQSLGSFFSSTNFSFPLYKILNNDVKDDEINIGILLSNGNNLNKFKNYRVFSEWTNLNKGNLSLYSISLDEDPNQDILDTFSILNKGKLISSSTNRGIKRKLQKLIKTTGFPIAKDLVITAFSKNKKTTINLYPPSSHLYFQEPYVILGTTSNLDDFTIFIQGKNEKWFNCKKDISFENAKQVGKVLQRELAVKKSHICYEKFVSDGNPAYLEEANEMLEPYGLQPAFR